MYEVRGGERFQRLASIYNGHIYKPEKEPLLPDRPALVLSSASALSGGEASVL